MLGIETLDVLADICGPLGDDGCGTAVASTLIAELPGEDGGRALVAVNGEFDPIFVGRLAGCVCVEGSGIAAECGAVGIDPSLSDVRLERL